MFKKGQKDHNVIKGSLENKRKQRKKRKQNETKIGTKSQTEQSSHDLENGDDSKQNHDVQKGSEGPQRH